MAHELGHLEIDYRSLVGNLQLFETAISHAYRCAPGDVQDLHPATTTVRLEMLANKFAASILMPRGLVREVWGMTRDIGRFADLLEVSREAAGYRLGELKLL